MSTIQEISITSRKFDTLAQYQSAGTEGNESGNHCTAHCSNSETFQGQNQSNVAIDPTTGSYFKYRRLIKGTTRAIWKNYFANENCGIAQGVGTRVSPGTNTIFFIPK